MDKQQQNHWVGLGVSLIALALFVLFGKGVVLYGALMGVGMFTTLLLVGLKTPWALRWCNDHATATEILSTGGTFVLFQFFGGGTVTAGIASAIVCILTSAVLGFSKLGFLDRLIGKGLDQVGTQFEVIKEKFTSPEEEEVGEVKPKHRKRKGTVVQQALARAVIAQVKEA